MANYDYDLFVIGAGSGGVRSARMAATEGIKVAIAEKSKPGGTCVNLGCVPKKLYVHAAEYGAGFLQAPGFGWQSQAPLFDWPILRDNKSETIANLNGIYREMLDNAGVEMINGHARVSGPNEVVVDGTTFTAERILLATGGHPYLPEIPGKEYLLSSDQIFDLPELPKRMLIVGGGYIATEFAGIFHGFGVEVTQIYRGELFLRGFDYEIREFVAKQMRKKQFDLRFNCDLKQVEKNSDDSLKVTLQDGSVLQTDLILAATGRVPNTVDLGLEEVGVKLGESGEVLVDDFYQTNIPSIYALGDLIDRMQLTPVALAEGMTLVKHLYKGGSDPLDYSLVPTAVFSQPNIGSVGLTEEEAVEHYPEVDVYTANFRSLKHALSGSSERVLVKLLVDPGSDKVLGAHMAGELAGETIQGIAVALKAGATKTDFDKTIGIHPTSAEEFVTMRTKTRTVSK